MLLRILPFVTLILAIDVSAQYRWDFGANIGASNYLGEIGGGAGTRRDFIYDMKLNRTQYVFGGFARYRYSPSLAFNFGVNYGRIRGNDFNSQNPARVARNLSFRNNILEFSGRVELTLYYDNDASGRGYYNPDFRVFGFLGAGVIKHNPRARYFGDLEEYDGQLVALQPLRTEGVDYSLWQAVIPAGVGLYFTYKKTHRIGWEFGYRFTFTDYLDDVSTSYATRDVMSQANNDLAWELSNRTTQAILDKLNADLIASGDLPIAINNFEPGQKRGDPTNNDGFLFTQLTYSYALKGRSSFSKARYSWVKSKKRGRRKTRAKF